MYSPGQLYQTYTENPCSSIDNNGAGTPYLLDELTIFLKNIKYPCIKNVPGYSGLKNNEYNGSGQIALPYKYLQIFDPHLFSEIQPTILAGTAHAIRNACDVSRACDLVSYSNYTKLYSVIGQSAIKNWGARGATEHMTFFGQNYLTRCLFVLGPNLTDSNTASSRGTGCDEMDCLPPFKPGQKISALGAGFSCQEDDNGDKECTPCKKCPEDDDDDPCCQGLSCADRANICCGDPPGDSDIFFYTFSKNSDVFKAPTYDRNTESDHSSIYHAAHLIRKLYGGYINVQDCSDRFWTCPINLALTYIQNNNGYNYLTHESKTSALFSRVKTIMYVNTVEDIKMLLYNGYGIVVSSNIGFSRKKDSYGLAFPDKIWYHSYAIVGYDDTKEYFDECVYVLANSWGDWNTGGHPPWDKLPNGCFLVTESHLKGMIALERMDKIGCKNKKEPWLAGDGVRFIDVPGCVLDNDCIPWECDKKQSPKGIAFGICFDDSLQPRRFDYIKFIKPQTTKYKHSGYTTVRISGAIDDSETYNILINDNISGLLKRTALTDINLDQKPSTHSNLPNLNLDLSANSGSDVITYSKNNLKNYYLKYNNNTQLIDESFVLLSNNLKIIGEQENDSIYINSIYGNTITTSGLSGLKVNYIEGKNVIFSELKNIDIANPELKVLNIDAQYVVLNNCDLDKLNLNINASRYIVASNSKIKQSNCNAPLVIFQASESECNINGHALFLAGSTNSGSVRGDALFSNTIIDLKIPNIELSDSGTSSKNTGYVYGNAFFEQSNNEGGFIQGDCYLDTQSTSSGTVGGRIIKQNKVVL